MLDDRPYMRNDYRSDGIQFQWNGRYHWSVTWALLIACVVCFILQSILESQIGKDTVDNYLALSSEGLRHGRIYELITFQFMHDGFWHLFGNLFGLFFFGRAMEEMLGGKGLLKLYLLSGTLGGLLQVALGFLFERFSGGCGWSLGWGFRVNCGFCRQPSESANHSSGFLCSSSNVPSQVNPSL